ncbi:hypothetical protein BOW53_10785 [Solemya pervernicosa gill symbiont]|uniref:Rhodanese domain-containing protein n=3 Tax=Gammaproteobacteria incertae sedis TaxID=118884 RepID=A0A1T2L3H5_9GAMM|nr:rhodanese-like domain-containing protein [Solemya pervernicosa gill symbiont]OOZ39622.1 hypothetical protein BOW53_10785 [Solemya pervernicosa gill symbiont]QKQ25447.1 rhodanese-like domain-containing protein [Candidatus Reidiella endopervernicosa]
MQDFIAFATQNWVLFMTLLFVFTMILFEEFSRRTRGYEDIAPEQATRVINHDDAVLLDVRDDKEYRQDGHINDSIHIPLGDLQRRMEELDKYKGKPVIAYCRSGHRSRGALSMLKREGFETLYNLGGGIMAWQNANLPVSRKK